MELEKIADALVTGCSDNCWLDTRVRKGFEGWPMEEMAPRSSGEVGNWMRKAQEGRSERRAPGEIRSCSYRQRELSQRCQLRHWGAETVWRRVRITVFMVVMSSSCVASSSPATRRITPILSKREMENSKTTPHLCQTATILEMFCYSSIHFVKKNFLQCLEAPGCMFIFLITQQRMKSAGFLTIWCRAKCDKLRICLYIPVNSKLYFTTHQSIKPDIFFIAFALFQFCQWALHRLQTLFRQLNCLSEHLSGSLWLTDNTLVSRLFLNWVLGDAFKETRMIN